MMHLDTERSLRFIERTRTKIIYQKAAVTKLQLDGNTQSACLARNMLLFMEERLRLLIVQHSKVIAGENLMEVARHGK